MVGGGLAFRWYDGEVGSCRSFGTFLVCSCVISFIFLFVKAVDVLVDCEFWALCVPLL